MGRYGGFELSYGSDADVLFVHDPEDGVDQHEAATYAQAVANELRRLLSLPGPDPALEVDADLRPEGKQGPLVRIAGLVRRLLREVVGGVGGPGAAAGRRGRRRPRPAPPVRGADRPAALPRRRASPTTTSSRCAGSRPASTRSGCRAAPTPRATSSSAAAASPTSSGPSSCCRCGTRARCDGLRTPRTLEALAAAREAGLLDAGRRRRARSRAGARSAGCATRSRWCGVGRRPAAARHPRPGRGRVDPRLPGRRHRRDGQRPAARRCGVSRAVVDRVFWG